MTRIEEVKNKQKDRHNNYHESVMKEQLITAQKQNKNYKHIISTSCT